MSTYQMTSDQNAVALLFLCPNLKPTQESGHPGLLLLLETLFKKRKIHKLQNIHCPQVFPLHFQLATQHFPLDEKNLKTYLRLSQSWLPCPIHQDLESKLTGLPKSQLCLQFSYSWESIHDLLKTLV